MSAAPGEVRSHRFPRADAAVVAAFDAVPIVTAWLGQRCGAPVTVAPGDGAVGMAYWTRDDGAVCGIGGGGALAAALLARDCGGALEAGPMSGASVGRATREFALALRDALLPGGDWQCGGDGPAIVLRIEAGSVVDQVAVAVTLPPSPGARAVTARWTASLHDALGALALPVRLVLHEERMAVARVRALGVGDVLGIATAREVGLRIGRTRVARGRIVDGETGRIEIVARGARP